MTMLSTFSHTLLELCQTKKALLQHSFNAGKEWTACNVHMPLPSTTTATAAAADAAAAAAAAAAIPCNSMSCK